MNERGVALIAVLWVVAVLSGVVGAGVAGARLGQRASENRMVLTRSRWAAEACDAIAQGRWLQGNRTHRDTIDLGRTVSCSWTIEDPTARFNVNTVPIEYITRLLQNLRADPDSIREFVRVLSVLRRATPIWDVSSLRGLRGFDLRLLPHITVDGPGTVNVLTATPEVLSALPGMTGEAVHVLLSRRGRPGAVASIDELLAALSGPAHDQIEDNYRELARLLRFGSEQLLMRATGWVGAYGRDPRSEIEVLFVPLSDRFAVLRRRIS